MRLLYIGFIAIMLSGCQTEVMNSFKKNSVNGSCLHPQLAETGNRHCELTPWLEYWMQVSGLNWKERQTALSTLTSAPVDRVKMILLSHVPNTPYQSRLRAQLVARQFVVNHSGKLSEFIQLIVFLPAQEKLELESALTTQTQFNIDQEKLLQTQVEQLSKQEQQINKLLQIEKNIVEKPAVD
ncbi:MAG: hypothetical protein V7784_05125 [Oceanospirillaceae bacterium]